VPFSDQFVAEARMRSLKLLRRDPAEFSVVDASKGLSVSTLKVADWSLVESIRQNWCKAPRPASTTDESTIVPFACGWRHRTIRMRGCDTAL